jgi:hypothetical protein
MPRIFTVMAAAWSAKLPPAQAMRALLGPAADNPAEIGSAHSLAQSKRSEGDAVALDQCRVEAARLTSSLINRASGFAAANGSVTSISILISIPALRSRAGMDRMRVSSSSMLCDCAATWNSTLSRGGRR